MSQSGQNFFPAQPRVPAHKIVAHELLMAVEKYNSACLDQKELPGKNGIKKKLELLIKISALDAESDTLKAGAIFVDICDFVLAHSENSRLIDYVKAALIKILRVKINFSKLQEIRDQQILHAQHLPSNLGRMKAESEADFYYQLAKKDLIESSLKKAIQEFMKIKDIQTKLSSVKSINHGNLSFV